MRPLYDTLKKYSKNQYPFHMPGHKFGEFSSMNQIKLLELDATEATGLDNLYDAQGVIKEAMDLMANFYGAKESIFLTNGSTSGIIASLLSVCKPKDSLLVSRNCHYSVWNALILGDITPIYISPEYDQNNHIITGITKETVQRALEKYPEVKGAIIVSPTYEGITSDIEGISEVLHSYNKVLIVDEAHGAHFVLGSVFPKSSISQGADIVIHSMHKTLPTLTQSGLIHRCSDRISNEKIIDSLKIIQTSSPSYMMMGLMDYIRDQIQEHSTLRVETYIKDLLEVRQDLKELKYLKLLEYECNYDKSKIVILTQYSNIEGYKLGELLEKKYGIGVEAKLSNMIILMTTLSDSAERLNHLKEALLEIDKMLSFKKQIQTYTYKEILKEPKKEISPREIYFSASRWIEIDEAKSCYSSGTIMLYPPGIPLICLGEKIQSNHIEIIKELSDKLNGIKIDDDIIYIKVKDDE